jgi:PST family polysaccharide transporter
MRPPSLTQRTVGSALWMFSGTGIQAALRLLVLTILARLLGPREFGLAAAATIVIGFFRIFLQTGVRPALVQRPVLEARHVRTAFALSLALGLTASGLIVWLADELAARAFGMPELAPVLAALSLLLPIQSLGVVAAALLERELRFSWIVRRDVLAYAIGYGAVGIPLAIGGFGVWALVGAYLVQELATTAFVLRFQPHPKSLRVDRASARELVYFGGGFAVARFGNYGAGSGDAWVAGRWLGGEALGCYRYAVELTGVVASLFGSVLDRVLFPALAKVQGDRARLAAAYRSGVGAIAALVLPVSAALFALAPEIVGVVLGAGWEAVVPPFRVLALALLPRATYTMSDSLARATGAVYRRAWRQALYAALVIGLAWIGQRYGLVGLALGTTAAVLANALLMIQLSMGLAALDGRSVAAAHLAALPSFALPLGATEALARAGRALGLPDAAILAASLAGAALLWLAALRLRPRLLLGRDGAAALHALSGVALGRRPGLARLPLLAGAVRGVARAAGAPRGAGGGAAAGSRRGGGRLRAPRAAPPAPPPAAGPRPRVQRGL